MASLRQAIKAAMKDYGEPSKILEVHETDDHWEITLIPKDFRGDEVSTYPIFVDKKTGKIIDVPMDEFLKTVGKSREVPDSEVMASIE